MKLSRLIFWVSLLDFWVWIIVFNFQRRNGKMDIGHFPDFNVQFSMFNSRIPDNPLFFSML
jgi:hypothetical protein